ncbi:ABC transporter permease [Agrobacterium sp. NPDC090283]|uniref:ABC transporter permease n=1 Tax=Agrobacterium sp. NPDC090283 TaxID=3363920 RepID=UPI00383B787D
MTTAAKTATPSRSEAAGQDKTNPIIRFLRVWGTILVILAVAIGFSLASPYFLTVSNLNNIVFSMFTCALLSIGLTYVVAAGSFDLSIGTTVTTASIVCALCIPIVGAPLAIVCALLVSALIGFINGALVTWFRISGIVGTIGVMFLLEGLNQYLTGGYQVAVGYDEVFFRWLGQGRYGMIAVKSGFLFLFFALAYLIANRLRTGHYINAVGDNPLAAYYSGIPVYRWVIVSFVLSALFCGIAGIFLAATSSSAQPTGGAGYLLEAFAAVFLGATILGKGKPHVLGTLLGVFFLYMVSNGMTQFGIDSSARKLFNGFVLLIAVGANAFLNKEELHLKFI